MHLPSSVFQRRSRPSECIVSNYIEDPETILGPGHLIRVDDKSCRSFGSEISGKQTTFGCTFIKNFVISVPSTISSYCMPSLFLSLVKVSAEHKATAPV
jgi:hypothetical protein